MLMIHHAYCLLYLLSQHVNTYIFRWYVNILLALSQSGDGPAEVQTFLAKNKPYFRM